MAPRRVNNLTPPWGTVGFHKETKNIFTNENEEGPGVVRGVTWNADIYGYRIAGSDEVQIIILHSGLIGELYGSLATVGTPFEIRCSGGVHSILQLPRDCDPENPAVIRLSENVNLTDGNHNVFTHTLEFEDQWNYPEETTMSVWPVDAAACRFGPVTPYVWSPEGPIGVYGHPLFGLTQFKIPGSRTTQYAITFSIIGRPHSIKKTVYFRLPQ
ncbi:hypothetical protein C8R43DRAFT_958289 [Mycena crocata]|nr:hypothetical protein C8R43DRAFT_958289 [Mycena crocata]